jgi:hypothetical protein
MKRRDKLEDRDVDGKTFYVEEIGWQGVNSIRLVQDSDQWQEVLNAIMNLLSAQNARNFLTR